MNKVAVIASAVVFTTFACDSPFREAQQKQAKSDSTTIEKVANEYRVDNPDEPCPTVAALKKANRLAAESKETDPWGTAYRITCTPESTLVTSAGPDRKLDTPDDVRSH